MGSATCAEDESKWARWHDRPDDPLRRIKMTPDTLRWI
jgi:hypothetical protein